MSPSSPSEMTAAVSESMKERTGRTVEKWVALVRDRGPDPLDQNAVRRWLRDEHGVKQNSQWAIARAAALDAGWDPPTVEEQIDAQYAGPKAELRPIFDEIRARVMDFGDDVRMEGRKSYVPFVRGRQFLAVAAATRDRIDLGVRYVDPPDSDLLEQGRAPGQGTHRIAIRTVDEVTDDISELLHIAYEQNG